MTIKQQVQRISVNPLFYQTVGVVPAFFGRLFLDIRGFLAYQRPPARQFRSSVSLKIINKMNLR